MNEEKISQQDHEKEREAERAQKALTYFAVHRKMILTAVFWLIPVLVVMWLAVWLWSVGVAIGTWLIGLAAQAGFPLSALPQWSQVIVTAALPVAIGAGIAVLLWFIGAVLSNRYLGPMVNALMNRFSQVPVLGWVYKTLRSIVLAVDPDRLAQVFEKPVMVEWPGEGLLLPAFKVNDLGPNFVIVFIPTAPNPSSGYMQIVPQHKVIDFGLGIGGNEIAQMTLSCGLMKHAALEDQIDELYRKLKMQSAKAFVAPVTSTGVEGPFVNRQTG